jgi:F-type H+-transporting ATPase subunit epsilon
MIELQVISPDRILFEGKAKQVYIPTATGDIGVLPDFSPSIFSISNGELHIIDEGGKEHIIIVSEGVSNICFNKMTVNVITGVFVHEINISKVQKDKEFMEKRVLEDISEIEAARLKSRIVTASLHISSHKKYSSIRHSESARD